MAAQIVFMAVLGAVAGSFLSVVAHRVPLGESIVAPRSRCPDCGAQIAAYDNVPILSYVFLRGRCRHCEAPVPLRYPLIEVGLAAAFVGCLIAFEDNGWEIALGCAFCSTLAVITLTDLELRIIPTKVLIVSAVIGAGLAVGAGTESLDERAIAAVAAFAALFAVAFVSPRGMGMGDVRLAGVMGLYLGRAVAPALLIGFAAGALYGMALIARHGSAARKQKVPFGPFLALGGLVGLFAGDEIVDWYLDTFFDA